VFDHGARPEGLDPRAAYTSAAMLIETLDALARLDYADFEVLVIDNNTLEEAVWRPVEAHCAQLGARFRFFHVAPLAGFKAGALNYALARTRGRRDRRGHRQRLRGRCALAARSDARFQDARVASCRRRRTTATGPERLQGHVLREYRGFFTSA